MKCVICKNDAGKDIDGEDKTFCSKECMDNYFANNDFSKAQI